MVVEWETGEITEEHLSIIATDDSVTCASYAKKHTLLNLHGWRIFGNIARKQKSSTRAIKQTKIRQARRSATYHFGCLIPRDYNHALELDRLNHNSRWYDATKMEMDLFNEYQVFKDHDKAKYDPKSKWITNAP